jgi:hypothetical protein
LGVISDRAGRILERAFKFGTLGIRADQATDQEMPKSALERQTQ